MKMVVRAVEPAGLRAGEATELDQGWEWLEVGVMAICRIMEASVYFGPVRAARVLCLFRVQGGISGGTTMALIYSASVVAVRNNSSRHYLAFDMLSVHF